MCIILHEIGGCGHPTKDVLTLNRQCEVSVIHGKHSKCAKSYVTIPSEAPCKWCANMSAPKDRAQLREVYAWWNRSPVQGLGVKDRFPGLPHAPTEHVAALNACSQALEKKVKIS